MEVVSTDGAQLKLHRCFLADMVLYIEYVDVPVLEYFHEGIVSSGRLPAEVHRGLLPPGC